MIRPAVILDNELLYVDEVPELHATDPIRLVLDWREDAARRLPRAGVTRPPVCIFSPVSQHAPRKAGTTGDLFRRAGMLGLHRRL